MKRTLKEKYDYNKYKDDKFSRGYCFGVDLYQDYPRQTPQGKATYKELINNINQSAKLGNSTEKGVMCGIRDAANDRKNKK